MYSPVAIFVYNRADNTQKTIEHLLANTLAAETDVFVFSDGAKRNDDGSVDRKSKAGVDAVRSYLHAVKTDIDGRHLFRSFNIIERATNIYLEANILTGIDFIFERYDTVIVLEDDICTSRFFLEYMNEAFELYGDEERVMHVSGFTNLDLPCGTAATGERAARDFYFTPHMSGWGWGTWRSKWQAHFRHYESREEALEGMTADDMDAMQYGGVFPCLKSLDKQPIPWDICWEMAVYKAKGLCLTPNKTMVRNIGLKNGTHFRSFDLLQWYEFDREPYNHHLQLCKVENPAKDKITESLFAEAIRDWGIRYTAIGKMVRFLYLKVIKSGQKH